MTNAADNVRAWLAAQPQLQGWRIQFGRWVDGAKSDRYAVLRPAGPLPASMAPAPRFTVLLVAGAGDGPDMARDAAGALLEAARGYSGALASLLIEEPTCSTTADGRPAAELALTAKR